MYKKLAIDFEYRKSNEFKMDLVCVAYAIEGEETQTLWLHGDEDAKNQFKEYLIDFRDSGGVLVCFNASAEGHSLISLGLDPTRFKWIDIQQEFKMQTNHYDRLKYGKVYAAGNIIKTSTRKTYYGPTRKGRFHKAADHNLATCTLKYLNQKIDIIEKNKMRDLILKVPKFSELHKKRILKYCSGDIKDLFTIYNKQLEYYKKLPTRKHSRDTLELEILYRGESSARSCLMESIGIPINMRKAKNLASKVQTILDECAKEITGYFPDINPFEWDKSNNRMKKNTKNIKNYIKSNTKLAKKWEKTPTGDICLKLEAFTEHFSFSHDYPTDNLYAQMIRYLKLAKLFNGLKPNKKGEESFFDAVGSDDRVRGFYNVYRAQSGRFQPKAKTFPFLWAAWIRSVVEPKPGKVICGIDYSSQEFLISALLSKDEKMIEAYKSGDPYMYLAKAAGVVPEDGTREKYEKERDIFKTVTLGISYGMTGVGLSKSLNDKIPEENFDEPKAYALIDLFYEVYKDYWKFTKKVKLDYFGDPNRDKKPSGCIKLYDGFYMFGDNDNERSVVNVNSQGMGSCILRRAIKLCQDKSLVPIFPLHDALYCEGDIEDMGYWIDLFYDCMEKAFVDFFTDKESASLIRLDGNIWGPDLENGKFTTNRGRVLKSQDVYIDGRAINDYKKFSKYMED